MKRTRRFLAALLAVVIMMTVGAGMAVTASAASVQSAASDGFFSGASTLVSLITKTNPVAGIITNGLLGAFKTFYNDATKVPQPSNQDIINLINELNDKIDSHYNAQSNQIKALESINKLQRFSDILTSVKGYNEEAMAQIALYDENKVCAQDYQNIINATTGNADFTKDFKDLSNLIIDGQAGLKGKPSFDQYLELSKASEENNNDADFVKKDAKAFNNMTMEQYTLYYTNVMSGCMASYDLADYNYSCGSIDEATRNSIQTSIKANMELYTKKATAVAKAYNNTNKTIDNLAAANVTVNGKSKDMFSFGDAWSYASKNNGTMKLLQDWKSNDLSKDVYYYKDGTAFNGSALYVKDKTVTLDLYGHSIIRTDKQKYDIKSDDSKLSIVDTSGKKGAINGILANGGTLKLDYITVKDSTDAGLRADHVNLDIKNTTFQNNANSAIVTETSANGTIDNVTFNNNNKTALYNKASSLTVKNSTFLKNSGNNGGAIYSHSKITIDNCNISENTADKGGAIYADYDVVIKNSTFNGNSSSSDGGAVCFPYYSSGFNAIHTVENSKFTSNKAGNEGGGIWCDSMNNLKMSNVEMKYNTAVKAGGGLYAQKGTASSCDPVISGKMTIIDNYLTNGTKSNAFLGENTTSKCIFLIEGNIDSSSRIGITSPTTDRTLDVVKIFKKDAYNNTANVFSYDTGAYRINRYNPFYSDYYWVEIVKN